MQIALTDLALLVGLAWSASAVILAALALRAGRRLGADLAARQGQAETRIAAIDAALAGTAEALSAVELHGQTTRTGLADRLEALAAEQRRIDAVAWQEAADRARRLEARISRGERAAADRLGALADRAARLETGAAQLAGASDLAAISDRVAALERLTAAPAPAADPSAAEAADARLDALGLRLDRLEEALLAATVEPAGEGRHPPPEGLALPDRVISVLGP